MPVRSTELHTLFGHLSHLKAELVTSTRGIQGVERVRNFARNFSALIAAEIGQISLNGAILLGLESGVLDPLLLTA